MKMNKEEYSDFLKENGFKSLTKLFEMKGLGSPLDNIPLFYNTLRKLVSGKGYYDEKQFNQIFKSIILTMSEEGNK